LLIQPENTPWPPEATGLGTAGCFRPGRRAEAVAGAQPACAGL